jgi:drug/metabolite transporter (DMT)-like permease
MVLLMSYFALKETLKVFEIVNMLISFAGVIFIVSMAQSKESDNKKEVDSSDFIIGIMCNALSAVCFSMINVIVRSLK